MSELAKTKENFNKAMAVAMGTLALVGYGTLKAFENHGNIPTPEETHQHIVKPGETEWDLANLVRPNGDTRDTVYHIDQLLPPDAAHADHNVQPGDKITYSSDGSILSYSEAHPEQ